MSSIFIRLVKMRYVRTTPFPLQVCMSDPPAPLVCRSAAPNLRGPRGNKLFGPGSMRPRRCERLIASSNLVQLRFRLSGTPNSHRPGKQDLRYFLQSYSLLRGFRASSSVHFAYIAFFQPSSRDFTAKLAWSFLVSLFNPSREKIR